MWSKFLGSLLHEAISLICHVFSAFYPQCNFQTSIHVLFLSQLLLLYSYLYHNDDDDDYYYHHYLFVA